jgi:hypothetical protein
LRYYRQRFFGGAQAKQYQYNRHHKLQGQSQPCRHLQFKKDYRRSYQEHHRRVAETPRQSNPYRTEEAALPRQNCGHGNNVVRIAGVPHPER